MKDAFGGSFVITIILTFFVIFICFMTVSISFAKTFRVKNGVVNYIEHNKGYTVEEIDAYLYEVAYSYPKDRYPKVLEHCNSQGGNLTEHGVCIVSKNSGSYYKVFAYIVMDFPLFNVGIAIPIGGETKIINNA